MAANTDEKSDIAVSSKSPDASKNNFDKSLAVHVGGLVGGQGDLFIKHSDKAKFMTDFHTLVGKYGVAAKDDDTEDEDQKLQKKASGQEEEIPAFTVIYMRGFTAHQMQNVIDSSNSFTAAILDSLSVDTSGNVSGGGVSVTNGVLTVTDALVNAKDFVAKFKTSGIQHIGFDFVDSGMTNIRTILTNAAAKANLYNNMKVLIEETGVNMFDCDVETTISDPAVIATIVEFFSQLHIQFAIDTFSCAPPWDALSYFAVAAGIYTTTGKALVKWFNLQTYSGGGSNVASSWYQQMLQTDPTTGVAWYQSMGLTETEATTFIKTIVSTNAQLYGASFGFTKDASSMISMIAHLRTAGNTLGGAGIWQFFTCYDSNNANPNVNWSNLYCKALLQGVKSKSQLPAFLQNYEGTWKCITQNSASYGYTYTLFSETFLVSNNNGDIRVIVISDITPNGDGFTWNANDGAGKWTHTYNASTGLDHDTYGGGLGIHWQKSASA